VRRERDLANMKLAIAAVLLAFVIAIDAKGYYGWRRPKEICDNKGKKYDTFCEFATAKKATCGSDDELRLARCNKDDSDDARPRKRKLSEKAKERIAKRKEEMKKKMEAKLKEKAENFKVCAVDSNGVEKTYTNFCEFPYEKACNKVKMVHPGTCGECTKENVCPWLAKMADKKNKRGGKGKRGGKHGKRGGKRGGKHGGKKGKVCDEDGKEYEDKCAFLVAKCNMFKDNKTVALMRPRKCDKESFPGDVEVEDNENDS